MTNIRQLIVLFFSLVGTQSIGQTITLLENDICDNKQILTGYAVIDPYHLPPPCLEYNELTLNLDLVFEDNFSSSSIDLSKWMGLQPQRSKLINTTDNPFNPGTNRPEILDFYDGPAGLPSNFDLSTSGILKLIARPVSDFWAPVYVYYEGTNPTPYSGTCDSTYTPDYNNCVLSDGFTNYRRYGHTSGVLMSERPFKYGYFEMQCKLPDINGVWPAFWLHTVGGNRTEIDIFELKQKNPSSCTAELVSSASHRAFLTYWDWNAAPGLTHPEKCSSVDAIAGDFSFANEWHNYALYWNEFKLIWFLDGNPVHTVYKYTYKKKNNLGITIEQGGIDNCTELATKASTGYEITLNSHFPNEQAHVIVGTSVPNFGGAYHPNPSLDATCSHLLTETAIQIDHIRVYGIRSCNDADGIVYYCSNNDSHIDSYITAPSVLNIAGNCNVIIENDRPDVSFYGHSVFATAGNEINIKPGFEVNSGAEFTASLQPCATADLRNQSTDNGILSNEEIKEQITRAQQKSDEDFKKKLAKEDAELHQLEISPNPAQNNFELILHGPPADAEIRIVNMVGAVVYQEKIPQLDKKQFNGLELESGIYQVEIRTANEHLSKKLIISK